MALGFRHAQKVTSRESGWVDYTDTGYTSGSPFSLTTAAGKISLINNANTIRELDKPFDVDAFYFTRIFDISSVTGTFVVGETITGGTSSSTARIDRIVGNTLMINVMSADFTATETIAGTTSGATATLDTINDGRIAGNNGDSRIIDIEMKVRPTGAGNNPRLSISIDIGGAVGEIYPRDFVASKGNGVEHYFLASFWILYFRYL